MIWPLLVMLGCAGNISALYEASREEALRPAGVAGDSWSPDIRARIRPSQLQSFATAALDAGLLAWEKPTTVRGPFGISATLTPSATVEQLRVIVGSDCESCLSVTGNLAGSARWEVGGMGGNIPFTARIAADVALALEPVGDGYRLRGRVSDIKRVKLTSDLAALRVDLTGAVGDWARSGLASAPAFTVAELGGDKLPLRAATLRLKSDGIFIDALSDVTGGPVSAGSGALPDGVDWEVRVSEATVAAMLRRAAFEAGSVGYDVAIDPQSIDIEGDRFTMGLRLWRLAGRGWWRDYDVTGAVGVKRQKLSLEADAAEEVGKSPGAGLADPLALIAERKILDAIVDNLQQAVPGARRASIRGLKVAAVTKDFSGEGEAVVLRGTLTTGD
jgi:hypothetical protein